MVLEHRSPSRIQTALARFLGFTPRQERQGQPDTDSSNLYVQVPSTVTAIDTSDAFAIPTRLSRAHDANALFQIDGPYKKVLNVLRRDVFRAGYLWVDEDGQVLDDLMALDKAMGLSRMAREWVLSLWLNGDLFLHTDAVIEGGQDVLRGFELLPPLRTQRLSNSADRFDNPRSAFRVNPDQEISENTPIPIVDLNDTYSQFEVMHLRNDRMHGERYGQPLLASVHTDAKHLIEAKHNILMRRRVHGSLFLHHILGGTDEELEVTDKQVKDYQKEVSADPRKPNRGYLDQVTRQGVEIRPIQGDANLHQVQDITQHVESFFAGVPVPKALVGYADNINRDIFALQGEQYLSDLEEISNRVADELLIPTMRIMMLFSDVDVSVEPMVNWGSRKPFIAADFARVAQGLAQLRQADAISTEDAIRLVARELNEDPDLMLERHAQEAEAEPDPDPGLPEDPEIPDVMPQEDEEA